MNIFEEFWRIDLLSVLSHIGHVHCPMLDGRMGVDGDHVNRPGIEKSEPWETLRIQLVRIE